MRQAVIVLEPGLLARDKNVLLGGKVLRIVECWHSHTHHWTLGLKAHLCAAGPAQAIKMIKRPASCQKI